jgi:hypothetical protein
MDAPKRQLTNEELDTRLLMTQLHRAGFRGALRLTLFEYWCRSAVRAAEWNDYALTGNSINLTMSRTICETIQGEISHTSPITSRIDWNDDDLPAMMANLCHALRDAYRFLTHPTPMALSIFSHARTSPGPVSRYPGELDFRPYHRSEAHAHWDDGDPCPGPCRWCLGDDNCLSEDEWDPPGSPSPPDALNMCCAHRHSVRAGATCAPECLHVSDSWHRSHAPPYEFHDDDGVRNPPYDSESGDSWGSNNLGSDY